MFVKAKGRFNLLSLHYYKTYSISITEHSLASKARGSETDRLQVDFGFVWLSFLRKQESRTKKLLDSRFRGYSKNDGFVSAVSSCPLCSHFACFRFAWRRGGSNSPEGDTKIRDPNQSAFLVFRTTAQTPIPSSVESCSTNRPYTKQGFASIGVNDSNVYHKNFSALSRR